MTSSILSSLLVLPPLLLGSHRREASARPRFRPEIVETFGDTGEATCLVSAGTSLWVGTLGAGLVELRGGSPRRWDASRGLPGNRVRGCVARPDGIWVATEAGLARIRPGIRRAERVRGGRFLALTSAGPRLVAARADGVVLVLESGAWSELRLDDAGFVLAGAPDGRWALGTLRGKIYRSESGSWSVPPRSGSRLSRLAAGRPFPVLSLAFEGGDLRVRTAAGGYRLRGGALVPDPEAASSSAFTGAGEAVQAPEMAGVHANAAARWSGRMFLATDEGVFRRAGARWARVQLGGMPCGDRISALASFDGALWVGSFDRGLCRFDGKRWSHFAGPTHLPSDMVNDLAADGQRLYVATLKGLVIVRPVRAALPGTARSWTFDLRTVEQCAGSPRKACPWHASVNGVAVDPVRGKAWVADVGAVHRVGRRRWRHYYRRAGVLSPRITRIAARAGRVAVGTSDRGVLLSTHARRRGRKRGLHFRNVDDQQGVADNWVMDLAWDGRGSLWVATCTRGLSRLRGGRWRTWTTADGLLDDYLLSVTPIRGRIWVGTLSGLSILDGETVVNLVPSNGLSGHEVHDVIEHEGRVYVATDGGITVVDPSP